MSSKSVEQIKADLKQIVLIIENLDSKQSSLIDLDLSLEKVRRLYENISTLKLEKLSKSSFNTDNSTEQHTEEITIEEQIDQEALKLMEEKEVSEISTPVENAEEKPQEKLKPIEDVIKEPIEKSIAEPIEKSIAEPIEKPIAEPVEEVTNITETTAPNTKDTNTDVNAVLANQINEKTSLNDILANIKSDNDLASQLQKSPIQDLKTAISINDKIWFTRELFDGDNDKYLSSLEQINNAKSIEEAIAFADTFRWDKKETSTKRFLELIYRRFV